MRFWIEIIDYGLKLWIEREDNIRSSIVLICQDIKIIRLAGTDIEMVCIFQDIKVMAGPELLELLNHVVFSIIGVGDILILIDAIIVAFIVLSIIGLAASFCR